MTESEDSVDLEAQVQLKAVVRRRPVSEKFSTELERTKTYSSPCDFLILCASDVVNEPKQSVSFQLSEAAFHNRNEQKVVALIVLMLQLCLFQTWHQNSAL